MIIYQLQPTVILFLMLFYTSLHHQQISFIIFHIFFHFFIAQFFVEFLTNSFNPSTLAPSPPPLPPPHLINGQNLLSMTNFFNLVDLVMMLLSSAGRGDGGGGVQEESWYNRCNKPQNNSAFAFYKIDSLIAPKIDNDNDKE